MTRTTTRQRQRTRRDAELAEITHQLSCSDHPDEDRRLREELVLSALAVADAVAYRYSERGVDISDLQQVARTALVSASQRYDPTHGTAFIGFAIPHMTGELKRHFRDHTWVVRPPRRLQELHLEFFAAEERLGQELSREPTAEELARELDIEVDLLREVQKSSGGYFASSLDAPSTMGGTVGDQVAAPVDDIARVDSHWMLRAATEDLSDRERLVLYLRFVDEMTQADIGAVVGLSQMQVSRVLSALVARLRSRVLDDVG